MTNEFLVYLATLNDVAKNHIVSFQYISELGSRGYTGFYSSFGERMIFPDHYLSLVEAREDVLA